MATPAPDQCPNCEMPDGTVLSTVGTRRHYRCAACLWSWHSTVPHDKEEGD